MVGGEGEGGVIVGGRLRVWRCGWAGGCRWPREREMEMEMAYLLRLWTPCSVDVILAVVVVKYLICLDVRDIAGA